MSRRPTEEQFARPRTTSNHSHKRRQGVGFMGVGSDETVYFIGGVYPRVGPREAEKIQV